MTLLPTLSRLISRLRRAAPTPQPRPRHYEEPVLDEDQRPLGCGWFDSSHELTRGLFIVEVERPMWAHAST